MGLIRRWGPAYFILQGSAVVGWWILLVASTNAQEYFAGEPEPWSRLRTVIAADLVVVALGSLLVAAALLRGWRRRSAMAWAVAGALAYGTFLALDWAQRFDASPVGLAAMVCATAMSGLVAASS